MRCGNVAHIQGVTSSTGSEPDILERSPQVHGMIPKENAVGRSTHGCATPARTCLAHLVVGVRSAHSPCRCLSCAPPTKRGPQDLTGRGAQQARRTRGPHRRCPTSPVPTATPRAAQPAGRRRGGPAPLRRAHGRGSITRGSRRDAWRMRCRGPARAPFGVPRRHRNVLVDAGDGRARPIRAPSAPAPGRPSPRTDR